jgi:hypothetical protein
LRGIASNRPFRSKSFGRQLSKPFRARAFRSIEFFDTTGGEEAAFPWFEAGTRRSPPEDDQLLSEQQVLSSESCARRHEVDEHGKKVVERFSTVSAMLGAGLERNHIGPTALSAWRMEFLRPTA